MKKLITASVVLLGVCTGATVCSPAFAQAASGSGQQAPCASITIKDAAEYNAYSNAISQATPQAKVQAIEAFLKQYPHSVVKIDMLQKLMAVSQQISADKTLDAAKQLLAADPNNLRALTFIVYLETQQANGNQQLLDQAAADAHKGLTVPKDPCMNAADYQKIKEAATPIFYRAIAMDAMAKKDYKTEIDAITSELKSYTNPAQTTVVPALLDTYYLGNAYLQTDPKDIKSGIWFLTRFAAFAKPPYQKQALDAAIYWYKKYHCSETDAACMNGNPPPGFSDIQTLASQPANVFPPATYTITPAPPPPTPAQLAHQAVTSTPDLNSLALSDKEYILTNGSPDDAAQVWAVMNGKTAEVPGVVIAATRDSVQLAVSKDAQNSNTADFTINMKPPLKKIPDVGSTQTYIANFSSFTQKPLMIIMDQGSLPPAEHKAPAHHHPVHHHVR
jgi:hypothetical protein